MQFRFRTNVEFGFWTIYVISVLSSFVNKMSKGMMAKVIWFIRS